MINPKISPIAIGKGSPGKIPFLSSIKNVIIEPTQMPMMAMIVGRRLVKLKNMMQVSTV